MAFTPLAHLAQLHDGYRASVRVGRHEVLLIQHAGRVHLLNARCPHMGEPLLRGQLSADGVLRCPRHGFEFDITTGRALGEVACAPLGRFQPVYRDGRIGVDDAGMS
ncbi:MAG TPA: Rieske 2Fe-2S domain-containing protein [Pseudomonadales bacterium]|nr:Rieske 2Fe-2S domain-containing protein [Pseudomonadales bacterium]